MNAFGAGALTPDCALRFRYYFEKPTKLEVKLFFGRNIYKTYRRTLHDEYNRSGADWLRRKGVMFQGRQLNDGLVFTKGELRNQTSQLTTYEITSVTSPCLWLPCLIVDDPDDETGSFKLVRCLSDHHLHSATWRTPSLLCHEFDNDDNEAENEMVDINNAATVHIEKLNTMD